MKPQLELPGEYRSENEFYAEVGKLLESRGFFHFNGRVVRLIEAIGQEPQFVEVTPEYLTDYIHREFETVEKVN